MAQPTLIQIYGPVGNLETLYLPAQGTERGVAVINHPNPKGETDDCIAVIDHARAQHPQATQLAIAGFSFGGYVANFASQARRPDLLLLIGAALNHYALPTPPTPDVQKTLIIHGEKDEVVDIAKPLAWCAAQDIPLIVIPESGHFFHGKLIALRDTINRFAPCIIG